MPGNLWAATYYLTQGITEFLHGNVTLKAPMTSEFEDEFQQLCDMRWQVKKQRGVSKMRCYTIMKQSVSSASRGKEQVSK
eukprot:11285958-Karenia_brevis.AAC.1